MKKILFIGIISFLVCSCDVLDEKPQAIAVETFYNTAEEIEAGVNAIYTPLRNNFRDVYPCMLEESSDFVYGGLGSWNPPSLYAGLDANNINRVSDRWNQFYVAIRNANIMIEAIPKAGLASDAEKNKFMGETMFLRALAYFHLVRNWGAIPLRTVENMSEYNVPRTPESEVYALNISE